MPPPMPIKPISTNSAAGCSAGLQPRDPGHRAHERRHRHRARHEHAVPSFAGGQLAAQPASQREPDQLRHDQPARRGRPPRAEHLLVLVHPQLVDHQHQHGADKPDEHIGDDGQVQQKIPANRVKFTHGIQRPAPRESQGRRSGLSARHAQAGQDSDYSDGDHRQRHDQPPARNPAKRCARPRQRKTGQRHAGQYGACDDGPQDRVRLEYPAGRIKLGDRGVQRGVDESGLQSHHTEHDQDKRNAELRHADAYRSADHRHQFEQLGTDDDVSFRESVREPAGLRGKDEERQRENGRRPALHPTEAAVYGDQQRRLLEEVVVEDPQGERGRHGDEVRLGVLGAAGGRFVAHSVSWAHFTVAATGSSFRPLEGATLPVMSAPFEPVEFACPVRSLACGDGASMTCNYRRVSSACQRQRSGSAAARGQAVMQIGQPSPKNIVGWKWLSRQTRGRQERSRALNRASAIEPAAQRNNRLVAGSGILAGAPSPGGSLPGSPASGLPPLESPPLGSGDGSFGPPFNAIGPEVSPLPAAAPELPLEELLESGVQPIRKRRTVQTATATHL